jgi:hypothetical protein
MISLFKYPPSISTGCAFHRQAPVEHVMATSIQISETLWTIDGPVVDWFFPFRTRMTIARLTGDDLFIHAPVELTSDVRKAVESLWRKL